MMYLALLLTVLSCFGQANTLRDPAFLASLNSTGSSSSLLSGLVAYWKLTESSGNAIDAHSAIQLTRVGNVFTNTAFINSVCASNQYNTDASSYVTTDANLSIQNNFTISLWMKSVNNLGGGCLLSSGNAGSLSSGNNFSIHLFTANRLLFSYYTNSTQYGFIECNNALNTNEVWKNYVAVFYSDTAYRSRLWTNGTVCAASTPNGPVYLNATTRFVLLNAATASPINSANFGGMLSDVAVWNRALTTNEIQSLWSKGTNTANTAAQRGYPWN